jgi:hypothetical protein
VSNLINALEGAAVNAAAGATAGAAAAAPAAQAPAAAAPAAKPDAAAAAAAAGDPILSAQVSLSCIRLEWAVTNSSPSLNRPRRSPVSRAWARRSLLA